MKRRANLGHAVVRKAILALTLLAAAAIARAEGGAQTGPAAEAQAARLLGRMGQALSTLSYEGTLVYLVDNRMETLHLVHRVEDGRVQERLISLSGPVRTVARERGRVTCTMPDGHPISVQAHGEGDLLRAGGIDPAAIRDHYRVVLKRPARVAGRDTDSVAIEPNDDLRYGLRFELDRETGLPLKSDLIGRDGEPLEQLMFTSLSIQAPPPKGAPETTQAPSDRSTAGSRPTDATAAGAARVGSSSRARPGRWRFDGRPAGFEQTMHDELRDPSGARVEHFVFSDRVSAYSVYVEPDTGDGLDGVTRIGAVHAAGRRLDGYQITAVGEVPAATAEAAAAGARMDRDPTPGGPGR